jgi:hypothetical protein
LQKHPDAFSTSKKTRRGSFMRSEDFFGFARHLNQMRADLESGEHVTLTRDFLSHPGQVLRHLLDTDES